MFGRLLTWNLRHRRIRHVLNGLTIAVTVAIVMLFVAVMSNLLSLARGSAKRDIVRLIVTPRMGSSQLPITLDPLLRRVDGVKYVLKQNGINSQINGTTVYVIGEEDAALELNKDFFPVTAETIAAMKTEKTGAVISETMAQEFNYKIGQTIELPTEKGPLQLKVVGTSPGNFGYRVSAHYAYIDDFAHPKSVGYRVFASQTDADRVTQGIIEQTKNSDTPVTAFSDSQFVSEQVRQNAVVPALFGFLGAFLLLTTALTLANNNAIAIRERRIEMATLRVLGYQRSTIMNLMIAESVLIGLIGAVVAILVIKLGFPNGIQLAVGSAKTIASVKLTPAAIGVGLLTAVVIPLLGALPAAIASIRMPLVNALRDAA